MITVLTQLTNPQSEWKINLLSVQQLLAFYFSFCLTNSWLSNLCPCFNHRRGMSVTTTNYNLLCFDVAGCRNLFCLQQALTNISNTPPERYSQGHCYSLACCSSQPHFALSEATRLVRLGIHCEGNLQETNRSNLAVTIES